MATPKQMFTNKLNALKGWPSANAIDKSAKVTDGELGILSGRVVHIDPVTEAFKLGMGTANAMPMFANVSQDDFDAIGGLGEFNTASYGNRKGVVGLVCSATIELATTEFVSGQTYAVNTPLTCVETAGADKGKIVPGAFYTNPICGIVSGKQSTNANGVDVVSLWTYFLPKQA
jgi:hypothetical protein